MNGGCIDRAPHVVDRERSPYPVAVVGVKGAGAAVVVLAGVVRVGHLVEDAQVHPVCRLIRVDECTWIIEVGGRRVDWGHIDRIGVYKTHKNIYAYTVPSSLTVELMDANLQAVYGFSTSFDVRQWPGPVCDVVLMIAQNG